MTTTVRRFRPWRRSRSAAEVEQVMTLTAHLRELRNRVFKSMVAIVIGGVVGWIYYKPLFDLLVHPYYKAVGTLDVEGTLAFRGVASALTFQLQLALLASVLVSSPIWLYQIWGFVTPGLHRNERRWAVIFSVVAGPLFLAGAALAYVFLPLGIHVLLGFTPDNVTNIVDVPEYLSFVTRMLLVFGLAFELPVFLVLLNFAGVVSGEKLGKWRRGVVFGIFVFGAVATPTGDPMTMLLLSAPMWILFEIAVVVCRIHDKRKRARDPYENLADDELSPI